MTSEFMTNPKPQPREKLRFAVTAPKFASDGRYIVSRHATVYAARRAASGKVGFEVIEILYREISA
mgnify:CR=1 FL=1